MGIPWYFYNIYTKYNIENDLVINEDDINNLNIKDLFLDYNSMIHPCSQKEIELYELEIQEKNILFNEYELEQRIIENCLNYTRYIISIIKPKYVYIMIDGVAPRAKINQQRERRYKSHFFKNIQHNDLDNNKIKINWNSNKITPGTLFMDKLSNALNSFKIDVLNNDKYSYVPEDIIISDSNDPGEGEHKMMNMISKMNVDMNIDKKICIYGLDADLIMLSLINKYSDNIILIRDNTFNKKLIESKRTYMYVNISKLKRYICKDLRNENINLTIERINDTSLLFDYIFLCFLLGNDFLEHIPSLLIKENGLNILVKYYNLVMNTKNYKSLITINNTNTNINIDMLKDIFYYLSKSEEYFFKNVYSVYKLNKTKQLKTIYKDNYDIDQINNQYDIYNMYFYKDDILKLNELGYKERYYNFYGINTNTLNINEICKNYLSGLHWILGYYNGHIHGNWDWVYKYESIPFASDIFNYLNHNKIDVTFYKNQPNTTIEQLFMVLPRDSLLEIIGELDINLSSKIKRIFNINSNQLEKYYPTKIHMELINKEYLWQSKIFLKSFESKILDLFLN